ncbi:MBL fold metallo-hydrolase [Candidatus Enterococcus courvalinii]|uniref:MBL fold metallo-hydrolase n=1 Tax=Candidatus Enterococcus courvalinii TaxID=2815329 RepID=A0ABS3HXF3_9ENTE|nr:MBL fold metallo-hydrolase [Enterococcus sp. MSG2901]MBO0481144.1 MBL fold metallo-hydrolase [Enterococcus sp. MSG2901]
MKKMGLFLLAISMGAVLLAACSSQNKEDNAKNSSRNSTTMTKEDTKMYTEMKGNDVTYYTMNPDEVFGATATIIEKDGKGLLVDTQFSKTDAEKILKVAKDKNIDIQTIYISYSDPDYYFGADQIKKQFPNAKLLATAPNIDRIKETYKAKLSTWSDTLKENAPDEIILPEVVTDSINLGGTEFSIFGSDVKKQTLYNKEDSLLLGGILVSTGGHLFMADTKTIETQEQWIKDLDELTSLQPKVVIPGHFEQGNDFSAQNIEFTKGYIQKFIEVEKDSQTSSEIIENMKKAYPNLPDGSLEMSAKVVTGEMDWE